MNKKILLISVISLMFIVFMSGSIFAATFTGLTVPSNGVNFNSTTGNLEVFYTPSNIGSIDLGNWAQRNIGVFNWNYEILDNKAVSYYVIYFDTPLDSAHEQLLDQTVSQNLFDSTDFEKYCGSDRSTLITALNNVGINPEFNNISCSFDNDVNPNFQITNGAFVNKTTGAFYIYLLEYNVFRSRIIWLNYYANLKSVSPYNGDLYTAQFIDDESKIFDSTINNYFTDKYVLKLSDVSSASNSGLTLTSAVSNNYFTLTATPDKDTYIYYSDVADNYDLETHFLAVLGVISRNNTLIDAAFLNMVNSDDNYGYYTAPITLGPNVKAINAIAVNYKSKKISNYLENISLISNNNSNSIPIVTNSSNIKITPVTNSATDYFCNESNVCYFNENTSSLTDFKINVSGTNEINLKLYTNVLSQPNLDSIKTKMNMPFDQLSSITNLSLGNYNGKFGITSNQFSMNGNLNSNYFVAVGLGENSFDKMYFVKLSESDYNSLIQFNIYKKIINDVYCSDCKIPDWMPDGIILELSNNNNLECNYPDPYKVLCDFNIFDLNNKINISTVTATGVGVTMVVKDTYFLELQDKYVTKKLTNFQNNPHVKLFFSELNNFNLSENEKKIFFSIIGGESSFDPIALGDNGESFGFVQLHKSWNTQSSFDQIKQYLPLDKRNFETYQKYFTDYTSTDANYSLYLGLAAFKYHLTIMKNTNAKSYTSYTSIENAFMQFYKHQLSKNYAETFFNGYNPSKSAIIDCKSNPNQKTANNRLECVSTVGSVRKMAWYVFANNNWTNLKLIQ